MIRIGVADHFEQCLKAGSPVRRNSFHESEQIRNTNAIDAASVEVRRECKPCKCSISSVAGTIDTDPRRIGDTLVDQVIHSIGDVVLHSLAPLFEGSLPEFLSISSRTAEVDL